MRVTDELFSDAWAHAWAKALDASEAYRLAARRCARKQPRPRDSLRQWRGRGP